ncbi:Disease resistance protein RGA2 [Euphorbia peplus]|nr:Disease resistance protein RGA2 [Euphorbia peplus]
MITASFVVSPVLNRILQISASLIQEEHFPLLSGYKDELEKLSKNLISIQAIINTAEEIQYEDETLKDWLTRLTEAAYDAENLLDTIATDAQQDIRGEIIHIASNSLQNISCRIEKIAEEKQRFDPLVNVEAGGCRLQGSLSMDYVEGTRVFGREREKEEIVDLLLSENSEKDIKNVSVFGINGRGGVGKTTLAHLVFNDERVNKSFENNRIWVSLAQGCTFSGMLQGIRGFPSKITCPESQYSGVETAFKEFLAGKRFLIILDNLSFMKQDDRLRLLQLLELGEKGSKVLYTSRTPHGLDGETSYILQPLSMESSRSLFKAIAFEDGELRSSTYLEEIGEGMVEKCEGSPLLVNVLGSMLRGMTWKYGKEFAEAKCGS